MVSLSPVAIDAFLTGDDDSTVVMLNLLRFEPDGGREKYLDTYKWLSRSWLDLVRKSYSAAMVCRCSRQGKHRNGMPLCWFSIRADPHSRI